MSTDIKINANQYLGNSFNRFKSELFALALSKPAAYFDLRQEISDNLKLSYVDIFYDLIANFLREGKIANDRVFIVGDYYFEPKYPENLLNEKALGGCKAVNDILDDILDLVIPLDYSKTMRHSREF